MREGGERKEDADGLVSVAVYDTEEPVLDFEGEEGLDPYP